MWHPQPINKWRARPRTCSSSSSSVGGEHLVLFAVLGFLEFYVSLYFFFIIFQLFLSQLLNFSHFYPSSSHPHPTGGEWMSSCVGLTHDTEPCWKAMQYVTNCQLLGSLFLGLIIFKNLMHFVLISSLVNYKSHPGIFHSNTCRYKEIFGYLLPFSRVIELNLQNRYSWGCY